MVPLKETSDRFQDWVLIFQVFHKWEFHKTGGEGKLQYEEPVTPPEHSRPRTRSPFQVPHPHPNTQPRSGTSHSRSRGAGSQLPAFAHTPPAPSQEPGVRHSDPGSGPSPAPRVRDQPRGSLAHTLHPQPQPRWDKLFHILRFRAQATSFPAFLTPGLGQRSSLDASAETSWWGNVRAAYKIPYCLRTLDFFSTLSPFPLLSLQPRVS